MSLIRKLLTSKCRCRFVPNSSIKTTNPAKNIVILDEVFQKNSRWKVLKHSNYLIILASGLLAYKIYKEKSTLIPTVSAASVFGGSGIAGKRTQFNFIADVVETSAPAVVYIEIKDSRRVDFFTGKPITLSNGSGFIIEENGLILTNAHVVTNKPNARVEVRLMNGESYLGIVEDVDLKSDLATVRIPAKKLSVMKLGNSKDIKPGEFVVAIGSPLSLSNTVTSGVISSTHRGSDELGKYFFKSFFKINVNKLYSFETMLLNLKLQKSFQTKKN